MAQQADVLIFDDDPEVGALTETLVVQLGYSCRRFLDGKKALELAREAAPRLIFLDIMMPGMDGLSLCRRLKGDPATKEIKVVIASGKPAQVERPRATQVGADAFLEKPFQIDRLQALVKQFGGVPSRPPAAEPSVRATFFGCRGYAEKPMEYSSFGMNTSCVLLQTASGEAIVLDAGSGIVKCGEQLLKEGHPREVLLLLSHYHVDHIQGLPRFALAAKPGVTLKVAGPEDPQVDLGAILKQCLPQAQAILQPTSLYEQSYALGQHVKLDVLYAQHPTTTLAFSLELDGRKIVYCPDSEIDDSSQVQFGDYEDKLVKFAASADLLIHNAHFTPEDYARAKGAGYSAWPGVVRVARKAAVRRLCLFHVAASYQDWKLNDMEKNAAATRDEVKGGFEVFVAREGQGVAIP